MYNKNKAVTAHKCTRRLRWRISVAERSYPTSKVRVEAGRTPCPRGSGQKELPHVRGQGQQPRVPGCDSTGKTESSYPASEVRGGDERSDPASQVRGCGQEELPHAPTLKARGGGREEQPHAAAAWAQEGLEELSHVEGQEGRR